MNLDQTIKRTKQILSNLRKQRDEKNSRKFVICGKCKKKTQIRKTVFIQTHWYVTPEGCCGGDYWNVGEAQFLCTKCGIRNRLLSEKSKELVAFKLLFYKVFEEHDGSITYPFVNI